MNLPFIDEFCERYPEKPSSLGFEERTAIERELFLAAKIVAKSIEISINTIRSFDPAEIPKLKSCEQEYQLLTEIANANKMLKILASGDVYLLDNIAGQSLPGRKNAIFAFGKRLSRIRDQLQTFSSNTNSGPDRQE